MFKLTVLAIAALGASNVLWAQSLLDPEYQPPRFSDIRRSDGPMTQKDYMEYVNRSWTEFGGTTIDKSHPKYSAYQKNPRFPLMDKNSDGSISQEEYAAFHEGAWRATNMQSMTQQDFDAWYQDTKNPLHPSYKKPN